MSREKVGTINSQNVYYTDSNGLLIRSSKSPVLRKMSEDEESRFLNQRLQFLGEYDYGLSRQSKTK